MNILSIGNSFSRNAQHYLHQIAHSVGEDIDCANLYIGGCPLDLHFKNLKGDISAYILDYNGHITDFKASIKQGLLAKNWDVVTVQQVSSLSFKYETYQPYLNVLVDYIKEHCPNSKIYVHQTWAYKKDSKRLHDVGFDQTAPMFDGIEQACNKAAEAIGATGIIRVGEAIEALHQANIANIHADDIHLSAGIGEYTAGLVWLKTFTGIQANKVPYSDTDLEMPSSDIQFAKQTVDKIIL